MAIYLSVDIRKFDGAIQLSIGDDDSGFGYRIAGPKYDGKGHNILKHILTPSDKDEIRSYLRKKK